MDWPYVYATVARNAGWTYRQTAEQPACDVFALLENIAEHPPSYLIDAAVHLKPKPKRVSSASPANAEETRQTMSQVFGPARKMPDHIRALVEWHDSLDKPKEK